MTPADHSSTAAPEPSFAGRWALVLGASSGFGAATSLELARLGLDVFGVHLDRRATMANVDAIVEQIRGLGREAFFVNINAADDALREQALDDFVAHLRERDRTVEGSIKVLLHSLAFGTLKPYVDEDGNPSLTRKNLEMTVDVMAHSLVYWVQGSVQRGLLGEGSSVYGMTSSGGTRVIPTYGAVSAAKAALESHIRQIAFELGPRGVRANAIRAGVTDTPALRKIPGNDRLLEEAARKNPQRRLTTPEDVAALIGVLAGPAGRFVSGDVVACDGGEDVVG